METNKLQYKVIFYENDDASGIIDAEHYWFQPTEQEVERMMAELNCKYAQLYYDKYDSSEYDELVCEFVL